MKLRPITLSITKQQMVFGFILVLIAVTMFNQPTPVPASQNFLSDIAEDLGLDRTFSDATAYLILVLFGMLILFYFFGSGISKGV